HTRFSRDWSSDVCSSDLVHVEATQSEAVAHRVRLLDVRDVEVHDIADLELEVIRREVAAQRAHANVDNVSVAADERLILRPDLRSEEHTSELQSRENLVC